MRSATTDGPSTPPAAAAAKPSYGGTATCSTRSPTAVPTPKRPPCSAPETACTPQATTWTASRKRAWSGKTGRNCSTSPTDRPAAASPMRSPSMAAISSRPAPSSAPRARRSYGTGRISVTRSPTAAATAKPIRCTSYRATTDRQHRRNSDEIATGHGQNGCILFFMPLRSQKRRQNKKLLLFLQENPKQTVTKSYGVQFQGDRAQVAAPLAGK